MKRSVFLLLTVFALTLCGCAAGGVEQYLDDSFHWEMTMEQAKDYLAAHSDAEIEVRESSKYTTVSNGAYIFRFATDGTLEFIKVNLGKGEEIPKQVERDLGKRDDFVEGILYTRTIWYKTVAERETQITLYTPGDVYYLEFLLQKGSNNE